VVITTVAADHGFYGSELAYYPPILHEYIVPGLHAYPIGVVSLRVRQFMIEGGKMKKIAWSTDYLVGIDEIDFQHQYFLKLIYRLSSELETSHDLRYRLLLLQELNKYAKFHFLSEENIMCAIGYPELEEHRKLHFELVETLSVKSGYFEAGQIPVSEIIDFLQDWFLEHTVEVDKEIGTFYLTQRKRSL
jgi:hemerythrin